MRIGIFGGTFDPFHLGHLAILEGGEKIEELDKIYVIPCGVPAFKAVQNHTLPIYRYYMTQVGLKHLKKSEILDTEIIQPNTSYTWETLLRLEETGKIKKEDQIYLIGGSDLLENLEHWYKAKDLLQRVNLFIAQRPGECSASGILSAANLEAKYPVKIVFFPIKSHQLASSEIRNQQDFSETSPEVEKFIQTHRLYDPNLALSALSILTIHQIYAFCTMLFHLLGEKRMLHSLNVARLSMYYAKIHHVDMEKATIAGLLHDCAKELPLKEQQDMAEKEGFSDLDFTPILHGPAGSYFAREKFHIQDPEILSAIFYHTTGKPDMMDLEKIVFLADKLEPSRDFEDLEALRFLSLKDLDLGMIASLQSIEKHKIKAKKQHPLSLETLQWFLQHAKPKTKLENFTRRSRS